MILPRSDQGVIGEQIWKRAALSELLLAISEI